MMKALAIDMTLEQDRRISEAVEQQRSRLRSFIGRRVADPSDVEDILQEVFFELVEAYRLMKPIETAGAWLFRVARNRIIDRFRKKKPEPLADVSALSNDDEPLSLEDFLPSPNAGPEAAYTRTVLIEELEAALEELPEEQRWVFIQHEIEARSFKELAAESGVSLNTLLSRKRYAVLHLRQRLQSLYDELWK
ncbi:MAG TPA: RNA polymerase sigma factor [Terriglobales bacterium]|jgi:RNA polymerase sigma factor (sigma-70 family)|nr:RNA polymerase sigma factor [Terriglobales bacterium]